MEERGVGLGGGAKVCMYKVSREERQQKNLRQWILFLAHSSIQNPTILQDTMQHIQYDAFHTSWASRREQRPREARKELKLLTMRRGNRQVDAFFPFIDLLHKIDRPPQSGEITQVPSCV